jgi:hypothetical protein
LDFSHERRWGARSQGSASDCYPPLPRLGRSTGSLPDVAKGLLVCYIVSSDGICYTTSNSTREIHLY